MTNIYTLLSVQREQLRSKGFYAPWVLVFDIDSTIMNTGPRNQAIADAAYAACPDLFTGKPLLNGEVWDMCAALVRSGLLPEKNIPVLRKFWQDRFFTNEWLAYDRPYPHVAECLHALKNEGFILVYLTGRDAPGMEAGTRKSFRDNGLPAAGSEKFIFKPDFSIPDTEFKKTACAAIAALGTITGCIDNMSDNSNLFARCFPGACHICLETVTPPGSQPLASGIISLDISNWQ